jgi:hypothetical protein
MKKKYSFLHIPLIFITYLFSTSISYSATNKIKLNESIYHVTDDFNSKFSNPFYFYEFIFASQTFSGLGANDSGGTGFKTINNISELVVSNNLNHASLELFGSENGNGSTEVLTIKADGINAESFDLNDVQVSNFTGSSTFTSSTIVFKDKNGVTIQTMSSPSTLTTSTVSIGSLYSSGNSLPITAVAEIIITVSGGTSPSNFTLKSIDISNAVAPTPCTDPDIPTVTASSTTICEGGNTNLNITGNLNDATNWHIYTGSCGGTAIGTTATGTFNLSPTTTTTYYIRGEGDCVTPGSCSTVTVNVTNLIDASFNYDASTYCKNGSDPTPTITEYGGFFTTSPAGIAMNITTGKINLTTSDPGTYTMTYTTTNGSCSNATSTTITINDLDNASFSYTKIAYCDWVSDPTPIVTTSGGTFSAPNGLDINTATGKIDLSESTHGTYTVTYTTNGPCPNSATTSVRINPLDDPSFAYSSIAFCNNAPDQSPIAIATPGGWFSSTNGLVITSNGTIDVSASTPGNYVITYTTNGNCMNSAVAPITIRASDDASFSYGAAAYCSNASDPSPTITGLSGGSFSSTAGLVIASNGTIDVSASTPGTYSITYTSAGTCPNSSTTSVTINALDDASFSYASATYCSNNSSPFPNSIATPGGTFSSSGGLSIDSTTGRINTYASAPGTHTVTYTTAGNCPNSATTSVTMNTAEDASFAYPAYAYCLDAPDPSPNAIASPGGTFSSTPGLAIAANGTIDVSASTPGTYTVTYTKTGTCPNSARVYITINALDDASFSYPASAYCVDASDPSPNSIATPGGTFSSTNGLVIALNGTIDVSASTPGTYSITYTTAGTCPNSASANLTINALDDASFSYGASSYTTEDADPSPTITGLTGGTFSAAGGLDLNASTGVIDILASTPGSYVVTYTTASTCPNSSTFNIDIYYNTYTWTGSTDNNWNNTSNWNNNMVPHSGGNVTIPNGITNYPTATSGITVNSITLNDGASFIAQASVNADITYTRNLPTTNWHLVSAPVSGETLDDVIANNDLDSGTGGNLGLGYYLNNTGPAWIYAQASSNIGIANGLGISIKLANPGNLSISGNMNTSNIIIPITVGTRTSFNLLGNPFISYVNSATFTSNNSGALTEKTLWLWDGSQYVTYNAASPIELAPGQGFFVEASGNNNVTFETSNQSHQTTDTFMRGSGASHTTFEIFVDSKEEKNSTKVFYINGKTTGFDNGYDSKMFSEDTSDLKIFTELITNNKGKKLAIQTLPNSGFENMVVPVGLQAKAGKSIEISVKGTNFPEGINVYLEDRINNFFTNLSEENYTITLDKDANGIGQFYIHTSSERLSTDNVNQLLENVSIYRSSKNQLTIAGLQSEKALVNVYSILGQKVISTALKSTGSHVIQLPKAATGVYIVELNSNLGKISKKIILE